MKNKCKINEITTESLNSLYNSYINILETNYTSETDLIMYVDNNYTFQLTNAKNEKNWDKKGDNYNISTIYLGECENVIKREKGIPDNESLIILKMEQTDMNTSAKIVQYEVYDPKSVQKIDLSICNDKKINLYIPKILKK